MEENDTQELGGESLSLEDAAAAFAKATAKEADTGQSEAEDETEGDTTDDELQASGEDEGEETDGEDDPEGDAEGDTEEEPESDQGRFVAGNGKYRMPDGSALTISELAAGYMKERDYRQKTMSHAESVKAFEAQSTAVKAKETELTQQLEYAKALVEAFTPQQPDISMIDPKSPNFDPVAYNLAQAQYQQYAAHHQNIQAQLQKSAQEKADAEAKALNERAGAEWQKALEAMPELKDPKKVEAFGNDILKYGAEYGYSRQELARAPEDHRQLLILKKAIAWDKLQASKANVAKKVEGRPPVQKGGKRLSPDSQRARAASDAMTRLKQSGSVEDATAAYLASLNKG